MLTPAQIQDLIHLRMSETDAADLLRHLTPDQVETETFSALLSAMAETGIPVPAIDTDVLDCCGTGGSGVSHFNTSTTAAFILAAGGVPVVKFGNRGMSSKSGSFDFLEGLGLTPEIPLERLPEMLAETGLVFLYAPQCYPALGRFNALRRSLGVKTVFNFLGPLLNPVKPAWKLLGVSDARMQDLMANHLAEQPHLKRAFVVRGEPTLDEIAPDGVTSLITVASGRTETSRLETVYRGTEAFPEEALPVSASVAIFNGLISGDDTASPYHHMVCLNAGAGFWLTGHADTLEAGTAMASALLADGAVMAKLNQCRRTYVHSTR